MHKISVFASVLCWAVFARAQTFPPGFQWCVATAGHQIEGDNIHSDWWAWEQLPGKIKNGDRSGKAAHHLERLQEDIDLMKNLGVKTYRFSIEWARIEPEEGKFDQGALDHYKDEIARLKKAGIAPMVTIHHWVQPKWFTDSGSWRRPDAVDLYMRYVRLLDATYGRDVVYWITFNEPSVFLIGAYGQGWMPPGETAWKYWRPAVQILRAHAQAYHYLHARAAAEHREVRVGVAHHLRPFLGAQWFVRLFEPIANRLLNWSIPLALKTGVFEGVKRWHGIPYLAHLEIPDLKGTQDFLGINYYTREWISIDWHPPFLHRNPLPGMTASDLNWGIDPKGFYQVLKRAHAEFPDLPFFITENGIADANDRWRGEYILSHLRELHRAMVELPVKVEGYCHWSMMDNFEWAEGFSARFGLYKVDYAHDGARSPRPSALLIKRIYTTNRLPGT